MRRREFILALGGAATAWPFVARAQQPAIPLVGFLSSLSASEQTLNLTALRQSLRESGYIEGQNITIEARYAEGDYARLQALTAELVGRQPAVIIAVAPPAALALKQATTTIPVVFSVGFDPVAAGLVASMNRPAGNATGVALVTAPLGQKRFEFLLELVPRARRIGMLVNPTSPDTEPDVIAMQAAAQSYGKDLAVSHASNGRELEKAFAYFLQEQAAGVLIGSDPFFVANRELITALAARNRLPAVYPFREYAQAGGLMSYGANLPATYHQVGLYVARILKGTRPADLPVLQPTKFELVINLKTAKTLGLDVPNTLLVSADEVIE